MKIHLNPRNKPDYLKNLMNKLSLENILPHIHSWIERYSLWQIHDPRHPDFGGLVNPEYGLADPHLDAAFITANAYLTLATGESSGLPAAILAGDHLLGAQRLTGRIDLLSVNYDSAPDTGFATQQLCTVIELARRKPVDGHEWQELFDRIETFIRRAVPGLATGGFHTPNHRWVMTSALVQAHALYPDLQVAEVVESYLAEGFDLDEEGMYIERSIGTYDAVNDRSLLLIAENWHVPQARQLVSRNLELDLHLLHADGTAETGLSRRQDYGTRSVPLGLAPCYLLSHAVQPKPLFLRAAEMLWEQSPEPGGHVLWLAYPLMKYGDPDIAFEGSPGEKLPGEVPGEVLGEVPDHYNLFLPKNGIWRVRRGLLSASAFRGSTRLLSLVFGDAELTSLKISQTYFGYETGWFISDSLETEGERAVMVSEGVTNPRRPGYEMPLGRPVPPERWEEMKLERALYRLPPARSQLEIEPVEGGLDLHYLTLEGLEGVAAQMAFDFPPGGIWETTDTSLKPQKGQTIFLTHGAGRMRYESDVIQISPGAHAHTMWLMREAQTAPDSVRVLLTFLTPVDAIIEVRIYRGLQKQFLV